MVGIISYSVTPEKNGWRLNFIYSGGFTLKNLQFLRYIFIKHIKVYSTISDIEYDLRKIKVTHLK